MIENFAAALVVGLVAWLMLLHRKRKPDPTRVFVAGIAVPIPHASQETIRQVGARVRERVERESGLPWDLEDGR
jgi:hypothetical protein